MTEWQPIETAPKDGTEIIGIYFKQLDELSSPTTYGPWTVAFARGKWLSSWDQCPVIENQDWCGTDYKEPDIEPTHWMPLPALPNKDNQ